jgi:phosphatidyl-myo-inositol dimannoside synthase
VTRPTSTAAGRRRLRLLALVTDAYGGSGGIARYNCDLLGALAGCADVERVVALPRTGDAHADGAGGKVVQLRGRRGKAAYVVEGIRAAARSRPVDVVFCGHLYSVPLAAALARLMRAALWVQVHGIEAWPTPGLLIRRAAEQADLVTAVSRHTRRLFLGWARVAAERVKVLPDTVDGRFGPGPKPAEWMRRHRLDGRKVLLTVSRLSAAERYKGHDVVLRAMARLAPAHPDLVYVVAGEGDDRPRLERLASELGVADLTRFVGRVPEDELPSVYRAADLFVMPSTGEGFGIVFLEALASGVPAVGGGADGSRDPLRDGLDGLLVSPDSDAQVADAIAGALYGNPTASAGGTVFARERFDAMVAELAADLAGRVYG